jgi:uncharacterized protein (TIGR02680 family)
MSQPTRFKPSRAGIIGLYQYGNETFHYGGGRIAFRGRNTSGKSKALELLTPFVLDGDIRPHKLDPFGNGNKTMAWNLVGCADDVNTRVGYVWQEYERVDETGQLKRVTVGIGMKGAKGTNEVKRWYWILHDERVGEDFHLVKSTPQGDYPLPRDEFKTLIEQHDGELKDTQEAYQQRINTLLFGFHSLADYRLMLDLIRELRVPKLSDGLKPRKVAELLSKTLPPVDYDLMRKLGESLEQLADMQAAVGRLRSAEQRIVAFTTGNYRDYARATVSTRADALRSAVTRYDDTSAAMRAARQHLRNAEADVAHLQAAQVEVRAERNRVDGEYETLLQSAEWKQVAEVEAVRRAAAEAAERSTRAAANAQRDRAAVQARADELDAEQAGLTAQRQEIDSLEQTLRELAQRCGLAGRQQALRDELFGGQADPAAAVNLLHAEADTRQAAIADADRRLDTIGERHQQAAAQRDLVADAQEQLYRLRSTRSELTAQVEQEEDAVGQAVELWAQNLRELPMTAELLDATIRAALEPLSAAPDRPWQDAAQRRRQELSAAHAGVQARQRLLDDQRADIEGRRAEIEAERDPAPAPRSGHRAQRDDTLTPLWQLVDFADDLPASDRAAVEVALEEAGILDALVGADDRPNDSRLIAAALDGPTLADVLVAAPGDSGVPAQAVTDILRSVAFQQDGPVDIAPGRFRTGPLHGRYTKTSAQYIGAGARAANRAALLAQLDGELAELRDRETALIAHADRIAASVEALAGELAAFPRLDALHQARVNLGRVEHAERDADTRLQAAEAKLAEVSEALHALRDALEAHCGEHGLPVDRDGLRDARVAVADYRAELKAARVAVGTLRGLKRSIDAAQRRLHEAEQAAAQALGDADTAAREADYEAGRLRAVEQTIGADAQQLKDRAERLGRLRDELRERIDQTTRLFTDASIARQARIDAEQQATEAFAVVETARRDALTSFRRLEEADMLRLALGDAVPGDHEQAAIWSYTRALEAIRALPADRLRTRSTLPSLTNLVQRDCSELDRVLGDYDMQVVTEQVDGMLVARISHGGAERTASTLAEVLRRELADRDQALSAEQQRIFGDSLIEEISEHLRARICGVRRNVATMNAKLGRCVTGSGKTVSLSWEPAERDGVDMHPIVKLIAGRSIAALRDEDRGLLIDFFRHRIDDAREKHVGDVDGEHTTAAYLMEAFDYRTWFEFDLYQHELDGSREKLTTGRHGTGSGGEQAVLMHMPLFAAAAALYDSARGGIAPRPIALDEALSGIDEETRPQVMRVTVELDLDVFLTAYEIKPYYHTVPRISVYMLHRVNGEWGVFAEWFLWDGEQLNQMDPDEPQLALA